jgi:hypothetical protein
MLNPQIKTRFNILTCVDPYKNTVHFNRSPRVNQETRNRNNTEDDTNTDNMDHMIVNKPVKPIIRHEHFVGSSKRKF